MCLKHLSKCALILLLLTLTNGCGGSSSGQGTVVTVTTGSFVGKLDGTDTCIAVIAGTEVVVAFISDGPNAISIPFFGVRENEVAVLQANFNEPLEVFISPDEKSGSVTIRGTTFRFTLDQAQGNSGLYRAAGKIDENPVWIGWIVENDGSQCGSANTEQGVIVPPPLDPTTQTFIIGDTTLPAAKVEPDAPDVEIDDPGTTFSGGSGFAGGGSSFGGFSQFGGGGFQGSFGGGGFQGSFGGGFQGSFGGGGGKMGFGGGSFNPGRFTEKSTSSPKKAQP